MSEPPTARPKRLLYGLSARFCCMLPGNAGRMQRELCGVVAPANPANTGNFESRRPTSHNPKLHITLALGRVAGNGWAGVRILPVADGDAHQRRHAHYHTSGTGHLYQGRFKSFPVATDEHLYAVLRYVERNPVRAELVPSAEAWRWSSVRRFYHGDVAGCRLLCTWPIPRPRDWLTRVNRAETRGELAALRRSLQRGQPFGSEAWCEQIVRQLGLESTMRSPGRPKKVASS